MALRDLIFQEGASVFGRLSLAFTDGTLNYPAETSEWSVGDAFASTTVVWVPSESVNLSGVNVRDGAELVEFVAFVDAAGLPDRVRLLSGMEFEYSLTVGLVDG